MRCLELEKENKQLASSLSQRDSTMEILNLEQEQLQKEINRLQENEARLLEEMKEANAARSSDMLYSSKVATFTKSTQTYLDKIFKSFKTQTDQQEDYSLDSLNETITAKDRIIQELEGRIANLDA